MLVAGLAAAQGTEPRTKASDYPASAGILGAEYLLHSIPTKNGAIFARGYLVVEVAVYGAKPGKLAVENRNFTLRIDVGKNGRKQVLLPVSSGMVASSLKYGDEDRPHAIATGSAGDVGVILGRPTQTERFPGDPAPRQSRLPEPPRAPTEDRSGLGKPENMPVEELLQRLALPEGEVVLPVSGYLYFAYSGKTKAIRSVELLYEGPAGNLVLKL